MFWWNIYDHLPFIFIFIYHLPVILPVPRKPYRRLCPVPHLQLCWQQFDVSGIWSAMFQFCAIYVVRWNNNKGEQRTPAQENKRNTLKQPLSIEGLYGEWKISKQIGTILLKIYQALGNGFNRKLQTGRCTLSLDNWLLHWMFYIQELNANEMPYIVTRSIVLLVILAVFQCNCAPMWCNLTLVDVYLWHSL